MNCPTRRWCCASRAVGPWLGRDPSPWILCRENGSGRVVRTCKTGMNISVADLHKAFALIERHKASADFEGKKPEGLVSLAESALGVRFPASYKSFLMTYGCGDIGGQELFGVIKPDFKNSGIPDAIWLTLDERQSSDLPESFVIVYATGDGAYYAIDCARTNEEGESPIFAWEPGSSKRGDALEQVADDDGQFLPELIEQAVS